MLVAGLEAGANPSTCVQVGRTHGPYYCSFASLCVVCRSSFFTASGFYKEKLELLCAVAALKADANPSTHVQAGFLLM